MIDLPNPAFVGVIHLQPLPGSPLHFLDMEAIVGRATEDARTLAGAGFNALIIENYGDAPFYPGGLPPVTVAAMAVVADRVHREVPLPLGINALRNDACGALGIAAACGACFVRVNVHTGVAATDQGLIEGHAHETLRLRKQLGYRVAILADVHVKHATPVSEPDIARAARDTAYRGLADALVVTGAATGEAVDLAALRRVREAVPDRRLFVGSGASAENVRALLETVTGVIVGTSIKTGRDTSAPVDPTLARAFVDATGWNTAS